MTSTFFLLLLGVGLATISVIVLLEQPPGMGLPVLVGYITSILGGLGMIALAVARWMRRKHPTGGVGLRRIAWGLLVMFLAGYLFDLLWRGFG